MMTTGCYVLFLANSLREAQTIQCRPNSERKRRNITSVQSLNHIRLRRNVVTFQSLRPMGLHCYDNLRGYRFPAQDSSTVGPSQQTLESFLLEVVLGPRFNHDAQLAYHKWSTKMGLNKVRGLGISRTTHHLTANYTLIVLAIRAAQDYSKTLSRAPNTWSQLAQMRLTRHYESVPGPLL